jgi:LysM repeat protein
MNGLMDKVTGAGTASSLASDVDKTRREKRREGREKSGNWGWRDERDAWRERRDAKGSGENGDIMGDNTVNDLGSDGRSILGGFDVSKGLDLGKGSTLSNGILKNFSVSPPNPPAHDIAYGDTLSQIAKSYGVTIEEMMSMNPQIQDPNLIYAGNPLNLP